MQTTIEQLTRQLPEEFSMYLTYCRNLKFEEKPDYNYLRKLFKDLMYRNSFENDYNYDWVLKKNGNKVPSQSSLEKEPVPVQQQPTQPAK